MLQTIESPDKIPTKFAEDSTYKSFLSKVVGYSKDKTVSAVNVCWDRDGELRESQYPCHNYVINYPMSNTTELHNNFCKQMNKAAENYINFLLSDESPYRALWQGKPDVFLYRGQKSGRAYSIHFTEMQDMPIKILANFLIASRATSGWGLGSLWQYLVDNNFTKTEALLIANPFAMYDQTITGNGLQSDRYGDDWRNVGHFIAHGYAYSDKPFHMMHGHNQGLKRGTSVRRLTEATPDLFLGKTSKSATNRITLKEGAKPNPSNAIWDADTEDYYVFDPSLRLRMLHKETVDSPLKAVLKRNDNYVWATAKENCLFHISQRFYDDKPLDTGVVKQIQDYLHAEKTIDF